ncbi:hypothetical protein F750_0908 [Streptomyces sp. PAMC 26508]|nr:hypothetical protein F750_0908 [Streptomyces sp. PAMC 26508]
MAYVTAGDGPFTACVSASAPGPVRAPVPMDSRRPAVM